LGAYSPPARAPGAAVARLRFFVDEDVSPRLVRDLHESGYDATCSRDRAMLGRADRDVLALCVAEDRVLVTANGGDFRALCHREGLHPGLIVLPAVRRDTQRELLRGVLAHVSEHAGEHAADFLVNRVVEAAVDGGVTDFELPA
jgi:predicted nuclease of predicted toxin-antitoxin system